jgi:hypothetical protein
MRRRRIPYSLSETTFLISASKKRVRGTRRKVEVKEIRAVCPSIAAVSFTSHFVALNLSNTLQDLLLALRGEGVSPIYGKVYVTNTVALFKLGYSRGLLVWP